MKRTCDVKPVNVPSSLFANEEVEKGMLAETDQWKSLRKPFDPCSQRLMSPFCFSRAKPTGLSAACFLARSRPCALQR